MINTKELSSKINNGDYDLILTKLYVDKSSISNERTRYINAINEYEKAFASPLSGDSVYDVAIFSAPGRSEVGGNHTDHQHGQVIAASINCDAIAVTGYTNNNRIAVISEGYEPITMSADDLSFRKEEGGTTKALIRGMLYRIHELGYKVGGFNAYITSNVPGGLGLSSSAAFETLIGVIVSGLFNDMSISAIDIAKIGQYAENEFFLKPCGLMDQMACSVGSLCFMDFEDPANPVIEKIDFDLEKEGYNLCITDTKGSHADLTDDYAAVPREMKDAAKCFGKDVLREVNEEDFIKDINTVRKTCGDRAALRGLHFFEESKRAKAEADALKDGNFGAFLKTFKASGDSSFKYLQNVYTDHDSRHQNVSVALAVSEIVLGSDGLARVHGGGFAGTIQAFVKEAKTEEYIKAMDNLFGEGSCKKFQIRSVGGTKVMD